MSGLTLAWRHLAARPRRALGVILLTGVGVGASVAGASLVDSLVVRPLPFPEADRLVDVRTTVDLPVEVVDAWRESSAFDAVEQFAAARQISIGLPDSQGGDVRVDVVSPGLLTLLGAQPIAGRIFGPGEARDGATDRIILGESLWRRAFAADPQIVGRTIAVGEGSATVVGVLPRGFRFPDRETQAWMPFDARHPDNRFADVVARLAPGVRRSAAEEAAAAIVTAANLSLRATGYRPFIHPLRQPLEESTARAFLLLAVAIGVLFLAACANVAGLVLTDLRRRRADLGVLAALGAPRRRILAALAAEHAALAGLALAFGLSAASVLVDLVPALLPESVLELSLNPIDLDRRAFAVAGGLTVLVFLITGLLPAWIGTRVDPLTAMRASGGSRSETSRAGGLARGLLAAQVGLAFALILGAALLARSFVALATADRGIDVENVTAGWVILERSATTTAEFRTAATAIEAGLRALPGIEAVAMSMNHPARKQSARPQAVQTDDAGVGGIEIAADPYSVTPEFFAFYGIRAVRGRLLQDDEPRENVVISQRLAARLWPEADPVGRTFHMERSSFPYRVVGVASEITLPTIDDELDRPEYYSAFAPTEAFALQIRCRTSCPSLAELERTIRSAFAVRRVTQVVRLEDEFAVELAQPRRTALASVLVGGLALIVTAAGLFSTLAFAVGERRRELAVRSALGASPRAVRAIVFAQAFTPVAVGIAFGSLAGWMGLRGLSALQYGAVGSDPVTWILAAGVLTLTAVAAAWVPARSAARTRPGELLRT